MDAGEFLQSAAKYQPAPVMVLSGNEDFLKRKVSKALRGILLGEDQELGAGSFDGEKSTFAEVMEEITTVSFFAGRRVAWVEMAEDFISKYRDSIEKYLQSPSANGILVLETSSWPSNTRLAKMLPKHALIQCQAPTQHDTLVSWCIQHSRQSQEKPITREAASRLVELIGADLGRLDQEITKLACYAIDLPKIEEKHVEMLVGISQVENIWKMFNYLGQGNNPKAFQVLEELLSMGEEPMKLLGAFSMQLRKLSTAARLSAQGKPMALALEIAGIPPFGKASAEAQLRKIGKARSECILTWLVEADMGMKGGSQIDPSAQLERILSRLSSKGAVS